MLDKIIKVSFFVVMLLSGPLWFMKIGSNFLPLQTGFSGGASIFWLGIIGLILFLILAIIATKKLNKKTLFIGIVILLILDAIMIQSLYKNYNSSIPQQNAIGLSNYSNDDLFELN